MLVECCKIHMSTSPTNPHIQQALTNMAYNVISSPSKNSINILTAGKTGTGKSSLVNSILGLKGLTDSEQILCECEIAITDNTKTTRLNVTCWGSPGVGDIFSNKEVIFRQLVEKCKDTDLLLYCIDMRQRLSKDDVKGITQLTQTLGTEIWKNAIFVLTFANEVRPPPDSGEDRARHFRDRLQSWQDVIGRLLREKLSVPEEIIRDLAIVPSGYYHQCPPDRSDWYTPFWCEVFQKVKKSAQSALQGINIANVRRVTPVVEDEPQASDCFCSCRVICSLITSILIDCISASISRCRRCRCGY